MSLTDIQKTSADPRHPVTSTQPSTLLAGLFDQFDEDRPLSVLETGPVQQGTVDFLSQYRCKLHVSDLFSELPIEVGEEGSTALHAHFEDLVRFPQGTVFDVCLFWDLFNYLDRDAVLAFLAALRPYLRKGGMAHCFGIHKLNTPQDDRIYGISAVDALRVRHRRQPLPGYTPHSQGKLKNMLYCFNMERSVLLSDGRLELLLRAKL